MKINYLFLLLAFIAIFSCDSDNSDYELVMVATPELMSKSEFRKSVAITAPKNIEKTGKIYVYNNYIFVNDVNKGIHILDNTNPKSPKAIKYIKIPGNEDISVKNNYLYADSATDLVVFDISNINSISEVERLEDVFNIYNSQIPIEAQRVDYVDYDYETDIIVGWEVKQKWRKKTDMRFIDVLFDGVALNNSANAEASVGTGGSLARFQIVDNYLYTVGNYEMSIFNIQNLAEPTLSNTQYAGWNIETMFQADDYLYLGSTNGMYIYSLSNPSFPEYISEFTHWEGCDPVVVDGDYAYLTLRGGNLCGQQESVLEIIDISDKTKPFLAARHTLENPYGLGIRENMLFVCDGAAGLKLFDKANPLDLTQVRTLKDIQSKDVIPLQNSLLMIGGNILYQYEYLKDNVRLISSFTLN
jgi:hypothetical protein